jgi:RNA polymerase sigma-70 factor (ECF subfamily)
MLISAAKQGRKNSFLDLCEFNLKKIYNFCLRMLANVELASIITEEVFEQAWTNIKSVRDDVSFELWLRGIAIYLILDEIRSNKRKSELNIQENLPTEYLNNFDKFLMTLDTKQRIIFVLHEIEGYKYEEISELLYEYDIEDIRTTNIATREKMLQDLTDEL